MLLHSPAFLIHSIMCIGHSCPTISWLESQDHKPLILACCTSLVEQLSPTLHCSYQSDPSSSPSSSPPLCSDAGLIVDIFRGVYHSRLKTFLFLVFSSIAVYSLLRLISKNLITQCLAVTVSGSVGECGRLSEPSWFLSPLYYSYTLCLKKSSHP